MKKQINLIIILLFSTTLFSQNTPGEIKGKIFDGEDINRNNILDVSEDLNGDGELTRYLLPPRAPSNFTALWNYPSVILNWNSPSEPVTVTFFQNSSLISGIRFNASLRPSSFRDIPHLFHINKPNSL